MQVPISIFILMLLIILASVAFNFYMYRWRRILVGEKNALMPEETNKVLQSHMSKSDELIKFLPGMIREFGTSIVDSVDARFEQQNDLIKAFKQAIETREATIEHLRAGYEKHIFKKGVQGLLDFHDLLLEFLEEENIEPDDIVTLVRQHASALRLNGIDIYKPDIGSPVTEGAKYLSSAYQIKPTLDRAEDGTIAGVVSPAYVIKGPEWEDIVKPCKVIVYQLQDEESS